MSHEEKRQKILDAIQDLFGDTSVDQETTKESLQSIVDEIEILIDALP